jgi:hypothetical protein
MLAADAPPPPENSSRVTSQPPSPFPIAHSIGGMELGGTGTGRAEAVPVPVACGWLCRPCARRGAVMGSTRALTGYLINLNSGPRRTHASKGTIQK